VPHYGTALSDKTHDSIAVCTQQEHCSPCVLSVLRVVSADLKCKPVLAPGNQSHRLAVHAALHGLIQGLRYPSPVIKQGSPVHHDLQFSTGQGGTALGSVCQHCQLCLSTLLQPQSCLWEKGYLMLGSGLRTQDSRPKTACLCSCVVVLSMVLLMVLSITVSLRCDDQTAGSNILPASSCSRGNPGKDRRKSNTSGHVTVAILTAKTGPHTASSSRTVHT